MSLSKAIGFISGVNECVNFFQWARSSISSLRSGRSNTQEQQLQVELLVLQSDLQRLIDTLPAMCELIDRAEWRSHEHCVAELLPKLKDAVYDADDLLDEFRWYELRMQLEGNASQSPFMEFFHRVTQGSFSKVNDISERLNNISSKLEMLGLREVPQRFDKSLRPETSSFPNEAKIFGRDKELKKVMELLGVPVNANGAQRKRKGSTVHTSTSTSACNQYIDTVDYNESTVSGINVLPIVGIGGVGKTTLAQQICNHPQVEFHFDQIIWTCVSDDFDVKRLTKEAIQSYGGDASTDHLNSLQETLRKDVTNKRKRLLIILDDMWDDALKENGQRWKRFCAPFKNVIQGSVMLVTTRSSKVSDAVRTMDPFTLDGLNNDIFWDFFKFCAFGSDCSNNDPELECIGRRILPKLKGSPLAAKTLGRLLRMNPHTTHWNNILKSELWELKQEETDILPALQLSYMYLPFHLKRCFSLCAVYPKDYKFKKESLGEIWVAEGFVKPEGGTPILHIGCQYFEDLVNRSFFQKVYGGYVIHDLMHDMAQLVSKHECGIIKDTGDLNKVPQDVRHLMILDSRSFDCSKLSSLCKHTKLRTLMCNKSVDISVMDPWCRELQNIRVFSCAILEELPKSVGNLKHLRYLQISGWCPFSPSVPPELCCLYNLQFFYAKDCMLESLPSDFGKLINLQRFQSREFQYHEMDELTINANHEHHRIVIGMIKNMNQFRGDMNMNLGALSKDLAAEINLNQKKHLGRMTLQWHSMSSRKHNETLVLQALHPPTCTISLKLIGYSGESLPSWFQPQNMPSLTSLEFSGCNGLESISFSGISQHINLNNNGISVFSSLNDLDISKCDKLSSLDQFIHAAYLPALRRISISECRNVASLPSQEFGEFHWLEELNVVDCQIFNDSGSLSVPTLKKLVLYNTGIPAINIDCCSLTSLSFSCVHVTSIPLQVWSSNLPALQELNIRKCFSLTFIGESLSSVLGDVSCQESRSSSRIAPFSSLTVLRIHECNKLPTLDDLMTQEYLPAIERIEIHFCGELLSLPGERFGSFPFLNDLSIRNCPSLSWQRVLVLPSSLKKLHLSYCGDLSAWFPSCLERFTSLVSLSIIGCAGIASFPDQMWSSNIASLQELCISNCPDLVSIGGEDAIAKIKNVRISNCLKLKELTQPYSSKFPNGRFHQPGFTLAPWEDRMF